MILPPTEKNSFDQALNELKIGGVVAVPTETVYGLAADIRKPDAIAKVFQTKERPDFDPLIVHLASVDQVHLVAAQFTPLAKKLAVAFWPGPLTMVLPKKENLDPAITSGLLTVAVRVPDHALTRALIEQLGSPIAAPSANRFGRTSPTTAEHVESEFTGKVLVLDGGSCQIGVESTVIAFTNSGGIQILRPGAITEEQLKTFAPVEIKLKDKHSPGHLEHHYMPNLPLVVLAKSRVLDSHSYERIKNELRAEVLHPSWMSLPDDPILAARLLYSNMRIAASRAQVNCLFLEYPLSERSRGLWAAITDRLAKAATLVIGSPA